jgi:hypothetical protein
MLWRKVHSIATDLVRVNAQYAGDRGQRNALREALKRDGMTSAQREIAGLELAAAPVAARAYAGLSNTSLTLAGIRVDDDAAPQLNLLIGEVREGGIFAGVHTAMNVGRLLADRLGLPLRVVMLDFTSVDNDRETAERFIRDGLGIADVSVVTRESLREASFGRTDIWLATHSKTAHAAQVAANIGVIDRDRVAYLIQDYEPGFSAWSTESVIAASTYHAGFVPIVNSTPLWRFLTEQEGLDIDRSLVFAPSFELERLAATAEARERTSTVKVLFYARRSKQRNLYELGISALRATVFTLGANAPRVSFFSAGEPHDEIDLGGGHTLTSLGRLGWQEYFAFLATTQVLLSLQQSPHPSHPPFDAAISGAFAVTNEFHGTRAGLHPRIAAVDADPVSLAAAVRAAIAASAGAAPGKYSPVAEGLLGGELADVVDAAVRRLLRA